jgi:hypothetical protein
MSQLKVNTIRHTGASSDAVTLASDGTCTAKITNNLSNRNLIINGSCIVAQRGTSSTSGNYQTVDRFYPDWNGTDEAMTQAQVDVTADTDPWNLGFRKALKLTNGNQTSGAGAADDAYILYRLEAQDIANCGWDYTSTSSYITYSFWVKSSVAQTFYAVWSTHDGTSKAYPISFALSADTWTKVTGSIPGVSGLQFDNDNMHGLDLRIYTFLGTDKTASGVSLNTWANTNWSERTPDSTSTWWTTNDATFEITGLQLEVGDYPSSFEFRSYGDELARCQRYYYLHAHGATANSNNAAPIATTANYGATSCFGVVQFPVTMRTDPAIDGVEGTNYFRVYANSASDEFDSIALQQSSPQSYVVQFYGNMSVTQGHGSWTQTNNAAAKVAFKAEL